MNLVPGQVATENGAVHVRGEGWSCQLSPENARKVQQAGSRGVVLGARHSAIRLHPTEVPNAIPGRVYTVEPTGDVTYAHVQVGSSVLVVSAPPSLRLAPDDPVWLEPDQATLHLFDGETQMALKAS